MTRPQILLFQTTDPSSVKKRLLRFREAFIRLGPNYEFAIVSYLHGARTEVRKVVLDGIQMDHYVFGMDTINTFTYPNKGTARPFKLIPGNSDLISISFRKIAPQYSEYWVIEDDVEYSGDAHVLMSDLNSRSGDLLATHLARGYEKWAYSSFFRSLCGSIQPEDTWLVFLTFFRISGEALDIIDSYYMAGWSGHNENTWATILKHAGMRVVDIGGNGQFVAEEDRNKLYLGKPNDGYEKHGSFGTKTIRLWPGRQKDTLWHPIKRPRVWTRQNSKRVISILKWHLSKIGVHTHQQ